MSIAQLLFVALPYVALVALVVGGIYRYRYRGFQVTSLSSQLLEGKTLFWGTQPFHWGLLAVFLGHLAAFAIPQSVLSWNSSPARMMTLELAMFIFALGALFGLVVLVVRRIRSARLRAVTSKMDVFLYALLLFQLTTGLLVAYRYNWGLGWFSGVLTPYLRSIFVLSPASDTMTGMPMLVQIHVISAFVVFGMIPFTRLIHFTVFPLNYTWRSWQQVIWNWNPKEIRESDSQSPGVRHVNN